MSRATAEVFSASADGPSPAAPCRGLKALDVFRTQFRPVDIQRDLVQLACESERSAVIVVVDGRAGVGPDIESFIPLKDEGQRMVHLLGRNSVAIDLQYPGAALSDAAIVAHHHGRCAETAASA